MHFYLCRIWTYMAEKNYNLFSDDSSTVSSLFIFYWHLFLNQNEACVFFKMSWPSCLWTFAHAVLSLLECSSHLGANRYRGQRSGSSHFQALDFLLCHTAVFWFALCVTGNLVMIVGSLVLVLSKPWRVVVVTTCHKLIPFKKCSKCIYLFIHLFSVFACLESQRTMCEK